jgi:hypothetical protein
LSLQGGPIVASSPSVWPKAAPVFLRQRHCQLNG